MKKGFFLLVTLVSFQALAMGKRLPPSAAPVEDLPRFYEVEKDKIYRGAQPTDAGLNQLQKDGIRTILDLRNEDPNQISQEGQVVEGLRMNFVSISLSGFFAPSEADMNRIQSILNDPHLQPVFVHCQHGQDRTGLVVGLHRVFSEHVSPTDAKAEMIQFGFHEILLGLNHYFEEHTEK